MQSDILSKFIQMMLLCIKLDFSGRDGPAKKPLFSEQATFSELVRRQRRPQHFRTIGDFIQFVDNIQAVVCMAVQEVPPILKQNFPPAS